MISLACIRVQELTTPTSRDASGQGGSLDMADLSFWQAIDTGDTSESLQGRADAFDSPVVAADALSSPVC